MNTFPIILAIEIDLYFVRERVLNKTLEVRHVPSIDQIADIFTKANSSHKFAEFRSKLRVENSPTLSLREAVKTEIPTQQTTSAQSKSAKAIN